MALHLVVNLVRQTQTTVVHGKQETLNLEFRIELTLYNLYCIKQLGDAL